MTDLDAEIGYFRQRITRKYEHELSTTGVVPPSAITEALEKDPFDLSPEALAQVERHLRASLSVEQTVGAAITSDYAPWLRRRAAEIDFFYWNRLKRFYLEGGSLPPHVVAILDQVTDEVLDYCGNPADASPWRRRGMVMGHVQSGKTTNYSALICKAADAGYKVIILLAGLTNSLRAQTQERLDETFIGRKSVFGSPLPERLPITLYADRHREPAFGTTRDQDFVKQASQYGVTVAALREPVIFVTKKNKKTLTYLRDWLTTQTRGDIIDYPAILIDDEADNASVDTSSDPRKSTAINELIREILARFQRSSYVGYTATPFANIFIDPDTDDSMLGNDLFPRHFIKALDPPSNYVGSQRVFSPDGDLRETMVEVVDDYRDVLPLSHKRDHPLAELPPSLVKAIRTYVVARAIRVLRGDGSKHCSMMINVSRFNDVQEKVLGLVYAYLEQVRAAVNVNAGLGAAALKDPEIAGLRAALASELPAVEFGFDDVLKALPEAVRTIEVRTVNMKGGELDYSRHARDGLHVIAIGGLALSRGLTLEGLVVSYILRNTAASDTLMQMARWFGYRPNYEDICRLYLPRTSLEHYEYIDNAIEELRDEVKRMRRLQQTPEQFGLKVRQSETAIRITAANKMRSARSLRVAQDYSARHVEGHMLFNDDGVNSVNRELVTELVAGLGAPVTPDEVEDARLKAQVAQHVCWHAADGLKVLDLIRRFRFPEQHPDLGLISSDASLFGDYVADRTSGELALWDVAILSLQQAPDGQRWRIPGLAREILLRRRTSGTAWNRLYRVTGSKNRISDPGDAGLLLSGEELAGLPTDGRLTDADYATVRRRPLLLVHPFLPGLREKTDEEPDMDPVWLSTPAVSLSFCTPATHVPATARTYQVNVVYQRQLEMFAREPEDDEAMFDDA